MLPPIPSWEGLHPVIVHFPIALFFVAPLLILIGLFGPRRSRGFLTSALVLMLVGTTAVWVAVATGEAAGETAESAAGVEAVLENHEELAETTGYVFTGLTVIFAAILSIPPLVARFGKPLAAAADSDAAAPPPNGSSMPRKIMIPLGLGFLIGYGAGLVLLAETAHAGGRLVHEFGVRAPLAASGPAARPAGAPRTDDDD